MTATSTSTKAPSVVSTASAESEPTSALPIPIIGEFTYWGQEMASVKNIVKVVKGPQATVLVHPRSGKVLLSVAHQEGEKRFIVSTSDGRLVGILVRKNKTVFEMNKYRAVLDQEGSSLKLSVTSQVICEVDTLNLSLKGPVLRGTDLIILSLFIAILL